MSHLSGTDSLQTEIADAMRAAFPADQASFRPFYGMMEYQLGWVDSAFKRTTASSGKLIRPMLVLLACRALGGRDDQALPLAAGIQLLHDFTLLHDDIEDASDTRRGRPTAWQIWGIPQAINAGDGMLAIAHRAVYQLADAGLAADNVLRIVRDFEDTILAICEGQYLDMSAEGRTDITLEQYIQMITGKTARLTAAAAGLGGRAASDDEASIAALWEFGEALGLAFQAQDDLLDIWGDPAQTGKQAANDLHQRKMSLPVIHGLQHASATDRERFVTIYAQPDLDSAALDTLLAILDRTGSRAFVQQRVAAETTRAMQALDRIQARNDTALAHLRELARTLLNRAF